MKKILISILLSVTIVLSYAANHDNRDGKIEGSWVVKIDGENLKFRFGSLDDDERNNWTSTEKFKKNDFENFVKGSDVKFYLKREAGNFIFEGQVKESSGLGTFIFTVNESFAKSLENQGYSELKDHIYMYFAFNF